MIFAIFSQINHLNEASLEADMDTRSKKGKQRQQQRQREDHIDSSWAAAQVETSNNFASQSSIWHVLSNGLNHQIEHHLFPGLNHAHLHHIAPVVRQTCEEFGVDYKSYDTWVDVMNATLNWYEKLSVDETSNVVKSSQLNS
jgi:fatty acid desaturase